MYFTKYDYDRTPLITLGKINFLLMVKMCFFAMKSLEMENKFHGFRYQQCYVMQLDLLLSQLVQADLTQA